MTAAQLRSATIYGSALTVVKVYLDGQLLDVDRVMHGPGNTLVLVPTLRAAVGAAVKSDGEIIIAPKEGNEGRG